MTSLFVIDNNKDCLYVICNNSWDELITIVKEIHDNPTICKTVVLDTADWSETLCTNAVCEKYRKNNIEDFGYGKGYVYLVDEYAKLLSLLDQLIEVGINVVITAHAKPRKFELPEEQGAFDRYEMKLSKQVAPLLKEWSDALFFVNYKIYVVTTENNSKKAQGGKQRRGPHHLHFAGRPLCGADAQQPAWRWCEPPHRGR